MSAQGARVIDLEEYRRRRDARRHQLPTASAASASAPANLVWIPVWMWVPFWPIR